MCSIQKQFAEWFREGWENAPSVEEVDEVLRQHTEDETDESE